MLQNMFCVFVRKLVLRIETLLVPEDLPMFLGFCIYATDSVIFL